MCEKLCPGAPWAGRDADEPCEKPGFPFTSKRTRRRRINFVTGFPLWMSVCLLYLLVGSLTSLVGVEGGRHLTSDINEDDVLDEDSDSFLTPKINKNSAIKLNSNNNNNSDSGRDHTGCPIQFGGRCKCGLQFADNNHPSNIKPGSKYYVVECTDSGFSSANMLQYLPAETEKLIFTGNMIPILEPNVFGLREYPKLQWIDMSNNKIEEIKGKAFHHVNSVEILILSNNDISNKSIHDHSRVFSNFINLKNLQLTNAFNDEIWSLSDLAGIFAESNLTKLVKLHLEQNEMQIIQDANMFCDLLSLHELYLADNLLSDLNINTSCFSNLQYVDVFRNQIRSIHSSSALYTNVLNGRNGNGEYVRVNLGENPFYCDCNLQPYIHWLKNVTKWDLDRIPMHERLHCTDGLPPTNRGLHITKVQRTECQVLQISNLSAVTTTLVWFLSFLVILLVLALMYFHRQAVVRSVQPLLHPLVHGVKYTSIDRQEVAEIAHV